MNMEQELENYGEVNYLLINNVILCLANFSTRRFSYSGEER